MLRSRETKIRGSERLDIFGKWDVAEEYGVVNGNIVSTDNPQNRAYYPVDHPELPARLARVTDEESALEFAYTWGSLGREILWITDESGYMVEGETVEWMVGHASTIRMLLKLIELREERFSDGAIRDYLQQLLADGKGHILYGRRHLIEPLPIDQEFIDIIKTRPREASTYIIASIVNVNTDTLVTALFPDENDPTELVRRHPLTALLPVIYGHLMASALGSQRYYQCAYRNCDKWNLQKEFSRGPKLRYCQDNRSGESTCARMERYHRDVDKEW